MLHNALKIDNNTDLLPFCCNFCGSNDSWMMANLGNQPLANNYLRGTQDIPKEKAYPLVARVCTTCQLCQVDRLVAPSEIFSNYAYFSSFSTSWVEHARRYTQSMTERFGINQHSLVIEIASNDGYLLQHFVAAGVPVLGVEPASNIAQHANEKGIRTVNRFMGIETGKDLAAQGFKADLIAANNVLAHVPDINDFVGGIRLLLNDNGVLTVEFHHLMQLLQQGQFDTIYHEHFSYLSLSVVQRIFEKHGLKVFDVEELSSHGGSLRVYACPQNGNHKLTDNVKKILQNEINAGLNQEQTYSNFFIKVNQVRESLLSFIKTAKTEGKTIIAYGAAAKGNTLLNYCSLSPADIAYTVDKNPHKQGHLLPGSHIPIVGAEKMCETKPDYVLILPWNLAKEITTEHSYIKEWGGKFITPLPTAHIIS